MRLINKLKQVELEQYSPQVHAEGRVTQISGSIIHAEIPAVTMYALCLIERIGQPPLACQVVGFRGTQVQLAPLGRLDGIKPNAKVSYQGQGFSCNIPLDPMGLVLDALGNVQNKSELNDNHKLKASLNLRAAAPSALERLPITEIFHTGIRAIDSLLTIGRGQRIAILAGPGSGKSTLVGMIARNAEVDVIVIGLIGERGREVQHFLENVLGPEGRKRSVVVVATSDQPALCRQLAANSATALAEYYREQGKNVLLIIDSLTRYARALREVSLAAGELPIRQGFTPSVFCELPALLERAGNNAQGTITAIYTVLTQNDMSNDVLSEELTSILDGHLVLSESLAVQGIKPAIDPCRSLSRLFTDLVSIEQQKQVQTILSLFNALEKERDLVSLGGTPSELMKKALKHETKLQNFIKQMPSEKSLYANANLDLLISELAQ